MAVTWTRRAGAALVSAALTLAAASPARAANLDLAPLPLFLGGMVDPNIMLTFDDSGSMYWSYMPDGIQSDSGVPGDALKPGKKRGLSASWNGMAYDPAVTYALPVGPDGVSLPAPKINTNGKKWIAWDNGYLYYANVVKKWTNAATCEINLYSDYRPTWYYGNHCDANFNYVENGTPEYHEFGRNGAQKAYYYARNTGLANCDDAQDLSDEDCYEKKTIATDAEAYNFAVWYSYYRKRTYTAKAGIARAFNDLSAGMRVGFARINKGSANIDGADTETVERGVRLFTGADKTEFYKLLFLAPATGGTPTREALRDVGRYFDGSTSAERLYTDSRSPWDNTPGIDADEWKAAACRSSYNILMSDGYWNSDAVNVGNVDDTEKDGAPGISGVDPFQDGYSHTLADVAMYYYMNDLQVGLANEVPPNREDKATWQHLVTYAVGLGLQGATVDPDDAFAAIKSGEEIEWPDPKTGSPNLSTVPARLDDMLHAAVNSRGGFFAAQNPDEFARALQGFVTNLIERSGSAASVVLNSNTLNDETRVYQAKFDSGIWAGQLLAYEIYTDNPATAKDESGTLNPIWKWDASEELDAAGSRKIVSFNGTDGVAFRWDNGEDANLTDAQKAVLAVSADPVIDSDGDELVDTPLPASAMLDFVRGSAEYEQQTNPAYPFRNRFRREQAPSPLGDIINSAPAYVGVPNAPYPNLWGSNEPESDPDNWYSAFRHRFTLGADGAPAPRKPVIYVGANDGMLHAFDAATGEELFAYIPARVIANLPLLADPDYDHANYVDGSPTTVDAFFLGDSDWHTVLVSGLNSGGQGIFALDVTDPKAWTSEKEVAEKVLWEFTDADANCANWAAGDTGDCDLGYTYSRPNVVRMHNGKWAAVFGNGYNNTVADGSVSLAGHAVLYVVDLESGELIKKISTNTGAADDPLGQARPNGLASVAPVDTDGDFIADHAYAGDLYGNLWKFDFTDPNPANWGVAYGNAANPVPLYVARSAPGGVQPITTRPQVARNPSGGEGFLVMFGTGKYLEVGDNSAVDQVTQTFYIILDEGSGFSGRNKLVQQKILAEVTESTADGVPFEYRVISEDKVEWGGSKGCYLDLYNTENGNTNNYGERQVSDPILRNGRVIFTTLVPLADDPCRGGGDGWLMELAANSCGRFNQEIFDVNGDGLFTVADVVDADDKQGTDEKVPPSGVKSKEGIVPMPAILARESGGKEFKYMSGSSGNIEMVRENPGAGDSGRQSWQQLMQ